MILIVGGAGYIGSHVNKLLSKNGIETIVYDSLVAGHADFAKWGVFQQGDLGDIEDIRKVFRTYQIDAVMHFAAFAYVGESVIDPQKYYLNNVRNTLNLLQVMLETGVKHFIFSSSCATYGDTVEMPITEEQPQNPINPYGRSKLIIENILQDYSRSFDLHFVSLRYFNAAGADPDAEIGEWHSPETHLIPLILDAAMGIREHIKIFGNDYNTPDGTCIRDYIHVNDIAAAHVLALDYLRSGGKSDSFNLGNGNGYSVNEVVNISKAVTGLPFVTIDEARRAGDPPILVGSAKKAESILQWVPNYKSLESIIETAWNWHKILRSK